MSVKATNFVWALNLPPNEKIVLLAVAEHINKHGYCWPSQERIAQYANISVRTARTVLCKLEERGVLIRERGDGGDGSGARTTRYRLNHDWPHGGGNRQILPVGATGKSEGGNRQTVAGTENRKRTVTNNKSAHARPIPLPDDWKPTDEHRAMAEARGLDVEQQALAFRFHAEANDRHQVRWNPAFSQWLMHARSMPKAYIPRNNTDRGFVPPAPRYPDVQVDDEFEPYFPPPLDAK